MYWISERSTQIVRSNLLINRIQRIGASIDLGNKLIRQDVHSTLVRNNLKKELAVYVNQTPNFSGKTQSALDLQESHYDDLKYQAKRHQTSIC